MILFNTPKTVFLYLFSIVILVSLFSNTIDAQDLSQYRWEKRMLVLIAKGESEALKLQVEEIRKNEKGLAERKLQTILLTDEGYYIGPHFDELISAPNLAKKYSSSLEREFEMLLIGLDGGVKKRYDKEEKLELIFAVIDGMPMRQSELRKKGE